MFNNDYTIRLVSNLSTYKKAHWIQFPNGPIFIDNKLKQKAGSLLRLPSF